MGYAAANIFGHKGYTVLLCDVKAEALESSAAVMKKQNMDVHYMVTDVTDPAQVQAAAEQASSLGTVKNVIHTAGLSPVLVEKMGKEEGRKAIMNVNAMGTVHMVEAFYPKLEAGASMVCFTSSAAYLMPQMPEDMQKIFYSVLDDRDHLFEKPDDSGHGYRTCLYVRKAVCHAVCQDECGKVRSQGMPDQFHRSGAYRDSYASDTH